MKHGVRGAAGLCAEVYMRGQFCHLADDRVVSCLPVPSQVAGLGREAARVCACVTGGAAVPAGQSDTASGHGRWDGFALMQYPCMGFVHGAYAAGPVPA